MFQSSPSREAGRYLTGWAMVTVQAVFQSSPSREAGRYATMAFVAPIDSVFQSSPSREAGRYLPRGSECFLRYLSFNPRPAVRPGATSASRAVIIRSVVSILAQP